MGVPKDLSVFMLIEDPVFGCCVICVTTCAACAVSIGVVSYRPPDHMDGLCGATGSRTLGFGGVFFWPHQNRQNCYKEWLQSRGC